MKFPYDHNDSLGSLSGLTSRLLGNLLAKRFHGAGVEMTAEQWGTTLILLNNGPMTQSQIVEQMHLEKSSVSRLVDGLEKRGWVRRSPDQKDPRSKLVTPTPELKEIARKCSKIATNVLDEAREGLDDSEVELLKSLLSRVIVNLKGKS